MARPKKQTIDYFSHDCHCSAKQTLFILEQKYGNDGYAFWFKLLEMLGSTEGHVLDCRNPATWQFLQAKTRLSEDVCVEILKILAELNAIDSELWGEKQIWSQNFVDRISDVYRNRRVGTPAKPGFYTQKPRPAIVSTAKSTQSKVKESKVKESKVKKERKVFIPPTLLDLENYKKEHNLSVDIKHFLKYFTEGNWIDVKGNKVISWKQKLLTWEKNNDNRQQAGSSKQSVITKASAYTGINEKDFNEGVF